MFVTKSIPRLKVWMAFKHGYRITPYMARTYADVKKTSSKKVEPTKPKASASLQTDSPISFTENITYTSTVTPNPSKHPVGPGALKNGDYKNPEYYSYNEFSYYDIECEMAKSRLPQPKAQNENY